MREQVKGFVVFGLMASVLLGALRLLSWIPEAIDAGSFRRFTSIEEVRAHIQFGRIYLPAFYPQSVRWPPMMIGAQSTPYPAIITEFTSQDRDEVFLVITQTAKPHRPLQERIRIATVRETVNYPFKGRTALLEVGSCDNGATCSRFSWEESPYLLILTMRSSPRELVRMAESMIPRENAVPRAAEAGGTVAGEQEK